MALWPGHVKNRSGPDRRSGGRGPSTVGQYHGRSVDLVSTGPLGTGALVPGPATRPDRSGRRRSVRRQSVSRRPWGPTGPRSRLNGGCVEPDGVAAGLTSAPSTHDIGRALSWVGLGQLAGQ